MEETKLTIEDLKDTIDNDDSVYMFFNMDPENIEDPGAATRWQAVIDALKEIDAYVHNHV